MQQMFVETEQQLMSSQMEAHAMSEGDKTA